MAFLHHYKLPSNEFWNKRKGNILVGKVFSSLHNQSQPYKLYVWVCKHRQYLGLAKAKKMGPLTFDDHYLCMATIFYHICKDSLGTMFWYQQRFPLYYQKTNSLPTFLKQQFSIAWPNATFNSKSRAMAMGVQNGGRFVALNQVVTNGVS